MTRMNTSRLTCSALVIALAGWVGCSSASSAGPGSADKGTGGGTRMGASGGGIGDGGGSAGLGSSGGASGTGGSAASSASGGSPAIGGGRATGGSASGGAAGSSGAAGDAAGAGASSGGMMGRGAAGGVGGDFGGAGAGVSSAAGGEAGGAGAANVPVLETLAVPGTGESVSSKMSLDQGELFLLKATGSVGAGADMTDAEFGGGDAAAVGQDLVAGTDVGLDVGVKVERVTSGTTAGRKKWFGPYRADHAYYMTLTGAGTPLTVKLVRAGATTSPGSIVVSIWRLSPTPAITTPLETMKVPVNKQMAHTQMTPEKGTVYLLQAAGSGKTGGANLGLGDADWMDWAADGTGKEDIGDNHVDYGLGVDEANTAVTPRLRWWGLWRKDHTYYLLYLGGGAPIQFMYYDSGYTDNSATDQLTVQVFAVPG